MPRFTQADLDAIYERRQTPAPVRPFVNAIFGQESSGGRANTTNAGIDGAIGPLQVIQPTFDSLRKSGRIPSDYEFTNPYHSAEAGVAYGEDMMSRFHNNPAQAAAAYFGGPGAVGANGAIFEGRADSNGKTIGGYVNDVMGRMRRAMNPTSGDMTATGVARSTSPRAAAPSPDDYTWGEHEAITTYSPVADSSKMGAGFRHAVGSLAPAVGGYGAAVAGAAIGQAAIPIPVAGALIGGLVGGLGGGAAIHYAQEKLFDEMPDLAKALGQDKRQRMIDEYTQPTASFVGGLLPNMAVLRPSTLPFRSVSGALGRAEAATAAGETELAEQQLALANSIRQTRVGAAIGAGMMGGMELGQQMYTGEPVDLARVGMAAAVGALGNKETALGRRISGPIHDFMGSGQSSNGFQGGMRTMSDSAYEPQVDGSGLSKRTVGAQQELFPFRPGVDASEQYAPVPSNIPANLPESAWPKWYADQVAAQRARQAEQALPSGTQLEMPGLGDTAGLRQVDPNQMDLFENQPQPGAPAGAGGQQMDMFAGDLTGGPRQPQQLTWDGSIKTGMDQPVVDPNAPPNYYQRTLENRGPGLLTYEPTTHSEQNMFGEGGNTLLPGIEGGSVNGQMRMRLPTPQQPDIPTSRGNTSPEVVESESPASDSVAPKQMDMFAETPTSTVITDFGIPQIVRNMRAIMSKATGSTVKVTSKLLQSARELSRVLGTHDSNQIEAYLSQLAAEEKALETRPLKSETIQDRLGLIEAKRHVLDLYMERMADASNQEAGTQRQYARERISRFAEKGAEKAKSGTAFDNTAEDTNATEQQMREKNAQQATEEQKAAELESSNRRVVAIGKEVTRMEAERRDRILQKVIAESSPEDVEANFFAALKKAGINTRSADVETLTPAERAKIDRFRGTVEAFKGDSGRQEELFSNQEAPVVKPPEGTPRSAIEGDEGPVEQEPGPDYLQSEMFTRPVDGSRATPLRQAMGTTKEQLGTSRKQLVAKADELLSSLRGGKSRDLLQRAVNQFLENRADYGLVESVHRLVKERKFAEAERNVVAAEPKKRAPRSPKNETPPAPPKSETPPKNEAPTPPKSETPPAPPKSETPPPKNESSLPPKGQAAVDQSKGTPAGVKGADAETQGVIREKAIREVTRAETEKHITTELANTLRKMLYAKDFAEHIDGVYNTLKTKRAEYERTMSKQGPEKKSPEVDSTEAANRKLTDEVRQATQAEREGQESSDSWGRGENPFSRRLQRSEGDQKGGMTVDEVNGHIEDVTRNWKRKPNIKVVQSFEDLPARLQDLPSDSAGAFDTDGSLYIIADHAGSAGDVRATVFHETLGHYGLQGKFGKALSKILQNAYESNDKLRATADRWIEKQLASDEGRRFYETLTPDELRRIAVEEVLANTSEKGQIRTGLMDRIVATIRDFGRKLGMDIAYSDADIYHILSKAHDFAMGGKPMAASPKATGFATPEAAATAATTRLRRDISDEAFDFIQERMPEQARRPLQQVVSNLLYTTKRGVTAWAFTPEIAENAYKSGVKSARKYVRAMTEREKLKKDKQIEVENILNRFDKLPDKLKGKGEGTVNKLLWQSTVSNKWAFKPEYWPNMSDKLIDPKLKAQFDAMPAEAQQVIKDVFKYGHDTLRQMKSGVLETVSQEYRDRLESLAPELVDTYDTAYLKYTAEGKDDAILSAMTDVRKAATTDELKEGVNIIQSSIRADTAKYYKLMGLHDYMPYAPIRRFGKYVVVGRSAEYLAKQEQVGGEVKQSELEEMKSNPDHYFVDFASTYGEAQGMARDLEARFGKGNTTYFEKDNANAALGGGRDMYLAFQRLQRAMTEHFGDIGDKKGLDTARQMISDLYISTLIDTSSRKSELRRLNVAGNDMDMMRAFASKGLADAHFVGNLFKNGEVLDSMNTMRKEVKNGGNMGRAERQLYVNELLTRHAMTMGTPDMTWANVINRGTSMWMLAMSPSYYLQNMSQPFMMSVPYMAGRHGYGESLNHFMQAYKDLAPMLKSAKLHEQLDLSKNVPKDVEPVLKELILRGLIDIGIDTDLGTWASQGNGKLTKHWNSVDRGLRNLVQKTETMNRLSTGIAAYRAEFLKLASENKSLSREARQAAAMEYAADVIRTTHGNYDAFSAPRYFNTPTGKVLLQFKKFQLIQLAMMGKLVKNSFAAGPEALIARKALGFTLSHAAALGGAMGLPGMAALAWAYSKLAGDEDEPADLEEDLRKAIGDPDMAQVLVRGAPNVIGLDMSNRMGMGNLLSVAPYTDMDTVNRDTYKDVVVSLLGPAIGGLGPRAADAYSYMAQGDYYKGLETLLPVGMPQGLAKAYRINDQGVTQRNSDVLIEPQDVADVTKYYTAMGLPSSQLSNQQWARHRQMQVDQFFKDRTSELKRDYMRAVKDGDKEAIDEARQAWTKLQDSRRSHGLKPQPLQELVRSSSEQARRESRTVGGLAYTPASQGYATQLAELTGAEGY